MIKKRKLKRTHGKEIEIGIRKKLENSNYDDKNKDNNLPAAILGWL